MRIHLLRTVCFFIFSIVLRDNVSAQTGPIGAHGGGDQASTRMLPRSREDRLDPEEARPEKENTLAGIKMLTFQGILYYYKDGVFYRPKQSDRTKYNEVETPMGISVPDIPVTAKGVKISGQIYFNVNGIYYKEYALY
ncbi:MAG: hypothetical protein J7527_18535, partial [Chitinophagaceae bacterium]|nr:hypothetical protein [Chitinophagaceae bacterium]